MMTGWNRAVFPELVVDPKKASAQQLLTTQNGGRIATSVGGALTGKGGDILIIDDPSKAEDVASETQREKLWEWFTGTAMTRLDNPKIGAIVVVAQRLHEDDLPGRLIATGQYEVIELPAIEVRDRRIGLPDGRTWVRPKGDILLPDHMDQENLVAKRQEIGSAKFEAQFQQAPVPAGGNIIKPEWFGTYPLGMRRQDYEGIIQSWDPAFVPGESNDYSVCTTWGLIGNYIDLLDVHRAQYLQPDLLRVAAKLREKWKPHLLIVEVVGGGRGVYDHLNQQDRIGIRPHRPKTGKVERMTLQPPKLESGQVRLPQTAPWRECFFAEAAAFPNGKYDDQVDSMSQALFALDCGLHELRHCTRFKG
jgi:predicted phage terminase large subunit-like protein